MAAEQTQGANGAGPSRRPPAPRSAQGRAGARPRPALDRDSVVDATLVLVATPGTDSLSFRKLGAAMGVDPTAFYRHFTDRDDLLCACIDRLELDVVGQVDRAAGWDERLRQMATLTYRACMGYPAIGVEFAQHTTQGPGERSTIELILGAMAEAGLGESDTVRLYGVYTNYVLSTAAAAGAFALASEHVGLPEDPSWLGVIDGLDSTAFPLVSHYRAGLQRLSLKEMFHDGLDVVLEAVRAASGQGASGQTARQGAVAEDRWVTRP